jgi:hypothetical protein
MIKQEWSGRSLPARAARRTLLLTPLPAVRARHFCPFAAQLEKFGDIHLE